MSKLCRPWSDTDSRGVRSGMSANVQFNINLMDVKETPINYMIDLSSNMYLYI